MVIEVIMVIMAIMVFIVIAVIRVKPSKNIWSKQIEWKKFNENSNQVEQCYKIVKNWKKVVKINKN
jgi:hypothetical protein